MGYLVSAFAVVGATDFESLARLPGSIGYRVLRPHSGAATLIEFFRAGSPPDFPFTQLLPSADIPLEMPEPILEALAAFLRRRRLSGGFKRSYINAARQISELVKAPTFALVTDDDSVDFACVAVRGSVQRVSARCGDLSITYDHGSVAVRALLPSEDPDEDEFEETDISDLAREVPGASLLPGSSRLPEELHSVASREFVAFTGQPATLLGLGDFDADVRLSGFEIVEQR